MKKLISLLFCVASLLFCACERRYDATVAFMSAPTLPAHTPVVVDEQVIGETTEDTKVVAGHLQARISLTAPTALPDQTIFVLNNDSPWGRRLEAHPRGAPFHLPTDKPFAFRGVTSKTELWMLIAREKAEELLR